MHRRFELNDRRQCVSSQSRRYGISGVEEGVADSSLGTEKYPIRMFACEVANILLGLELKPFLPRGPRFLVAGGFTVLIAVLSR